MTKENAMTKAKAIEVLEGLHNYMAWVPDELADAAEVAVKALRRSIRSTRAAKKSAIAKRKNGKKENAR